jgi:hypothetical protein
MKYRHDIIDATSSLELVGRGENGSIESVIISDMDNDIDIVDRTFHGEWFCSGIFSYWDLDFSGTQSRVGNVDIWYRS